MNKFTKQCVAAFASLAMAGTLCVAGAVVVGNSACAADTCNNQAPWNTACKAQKGKITINKKDSSDGNKPLNGAIFTIQKVTLIKSDNDPTGLSVDLTSFDGWTKLAAKVKQLNSTPLDETKLILGDVKEKTTEGQGQAVFDNVDLGLYLVKEKSAPTNYATDVKPFFMTVPEITRAKESTSNTYTYEVSVDPKNTNVKDNVTKTADSGKIVGAGDTLPYTITAKVNKKKSDAADSDKGITKDELKGFAVFDDAVTDAYESVDTGVVKEVSIGDSKLENSNGKTYYNVEKESHDNSKSDSPEADRTRIKVTFTQDGLEKIATAVNNANNADVSVKVKLELKLKNDLSNFTGSDKKLTNKSGFVPGHGDGVPDKIIPGGSADNEFRKFHILKVNGTDSNKTIKDAEFKAFAGEEGEASKEIAQKCANDPTGDNCNSALSGFGTKKTGDSGTTDDYSAKVGQTFYLVEVKAPEGFVRSTKVYEVKLETAANNAQAQVVTIENVPTKDNVSWFKLPKTGAYGVIIFALAGMCLVAVGMFIFLRNRKNDEEQQAA